MTFSRCLMPGLQLLPPPCLPSAQPPHATNCHQVVALFSRCFLLIWYRYGILTPFYRAGLREYALYHQLLLNDINLSIPLLLQAFLTKPLLSFFLSFLQPKKSILAAISCIGNPSTTTNATSFPTSSPSLPLPTALSTKISEFVS